MKKVVRSFLVLALLWATAPFMLNAETTAELSSKEGHWNLVEYLSESGDMLSVTPGTKIDAVFSQGKVSGSAGCNRYSGSYTIGDEGSLNISGEMAVTQMACPPPVSEMEQRYLSLLENISSYRIEDETLVLIDSYEREVLHFDAALTAGLVNTAWQAAGINNGRGGVVSNLNTHLATAVFAKGKITGVAGCNDFSATFSVTGNRLSIGPVMTTRKHCGEPAGIMEQEQEYLKALAETRVFVLGSNHLELRNEAGSLMVRYVPVEPED